METNLIVGDKKRKKLIAAVKASMFHIQNDKNSIVDQDKYENDDHFLMAGLGNQVCQGK